MSTDIFPLSKYWCRMVHCMKSKIFMRKKGQMPNEELIQKDNLESRCGNKPRDTNLTNNDTQMWQKYLGPSYRTKSHIFCTQNTETFCLNREKSTKSHLSKTPRKLSSGWINQCFTEKVKTGNLAWFIGDCNVWIDWKQRIIPIETRGGHYWHKQSASLLGFRKQVKAMRKWFWERTAKGNITARKMNPDYENPDSKSIFRLFIVDPCWCFHRPGHSRCIFFFWAACCSRAKILMVQVYHSGALNCKL